MSNGPLFNDVTPEERAELARCVRNELEYVEDALQNTDGLTSDHIQELRERQAVLERLAKKV